MFNNKRGESIVEVVVALGIFAFVFMGVVNIISASITLNLSSRQRTEGVAKTQKYLSEYLAANSNSSSCSVVSRSVIAVVPGTEKGNAGCNSSTLTDSTQTCYWLELSPLDSAKNETYNGTNKATGLDNSHFIKIISHTKWYTRVLGEQIFDLSQVVRNN